MTTDFVDDKVSLDDTSAPPTRWESKSFDLGDDPNEPERGGLILAALIALLLPLIIAVVVLVPGGTSDDSLTTVDGRESTGLDDISVDASPRDDGPDRAVATAVLGAAESVDDDKEVATSATAAESPAGPSTTVDSSRPDASGPTSVAPAPAPPRSTAPSATMVSPTTHPPSTTSRSATTAPTTTVATTASPSTIAATTIPVTTLLPDNQPDPPAFASRVEIAQIGETFMRYRFTAATTTSYVAVVRDADGVIATTSGTAVGGEEVSKAANGLTPGTDYTVRVRLLGPPEATSVSVPFRTSGGTPDPAAVSVEILESEVVEVGATQFVVNYRTNICANGSFVIRRLEGDIVGRNGGQADGCTTRHLAIPGFWTPALEPDVTYVLTISVEADGQGRGGGNTATTSVVVTTAG